MRATLIDGVIGLIMRGVVEFPFQLASWPVGLLILCVV